MGQNRHKNPKLEPGVCDVASEESDAQLDLFSQVFLVAAAALTLTHLVAVRGAH